MEYQHSGREPAKKQNLISGVAKLVFGVTLLEALAFAAFGMPMAVYIVAVTIVFIVNIFLTALAACLCA